MSQLQAAKSLVPVPDELTRPFWQACGEDRLVVQRCNGCTQRFFTPLPACPHCLSTDWQWVESPGTGTLYSYTVVHRAASPDMAVPYVVAVVDLDDGWSMMTNLVDSEPEAIVCGARVQVRFVERSKMIALPCFTLTDAADAPQPTA